MEKNKITILTDTFEGHAQQTENGVEFWLARDLQSTILPTSGKWSNWGPAANVKSAT